MDAPGPPLISQMREPLASKVPEGAGPGELVGLLRSEGGERNVGEENDGPPPEHESSAGDSGEKESGPQGQPEESQEEAGGAPDAYAGSTT